jgi:translation initiation factor 4A
VCDVFNSVSEGFEMPSSIQQMVIAPFCEGLDVILQDPSGTGMSATFCIGILKKLDYGFVHCQAVVLTPTSELALEIKEVMQDLGEVHAVRIHACVEGTSVPKEDHQRFLKAGYNSYIAEGTPSHIIVGTPGCVYDMLQRGRTRLDCIKMFVMDDVDEMLSLGFKDKVCNMLVFHCLIY